MNKEETKLITTALRQQQALNKTLQRICDSLRKERNWYRAQFENPTFGERTCIDLTGEDSEAETEAINSDNENIVPEPPLRRKRCTALGGPAIVRSSNKKAKKA